MLDSQAVSAAGISVSQLLMLLSTSKTPLAFRLASPVVKEQAEWFHGDISRADAITRLSAMGIRDGNFLVRKKATEDEGSYALSLVCQGKIRHDLVAIAPDGTLMINGKPCAKKVEDIDAVVRHLRKHHESLPVCLGAACPRPK